MSKEKNILIVDDSETNLLLLEAILVGDGFVVHKAFSAHEAQIFLNKKIPDVILLDLLMPNENGFDLLKKLRADNKFIDVPVIIVTAFANEENRIIAKELGAIDLIEKPIDIRSFLEKVNNA